MATRKSCLRTDWRKTESSWRKLRQALSTSGTSHQACGIGSKSVPPMYADGMYEKSGATGSRGFALPEPGGSRESALPEPGSGATGSSSHSAGAVSGDGAASWEGVAWVPASHAADNAPRRHEARFHRRGCRLRQAKDRARAWPHPAAVLGLRRPRTISSKRRAFLLPVWTGVPPA